MAGLCFFFESHDVDVWSGRRLDLDAWNYAAKAGGGIDRMIVVNTADIPITRSPDSDIDFSVVYRFPKLENAVYFAGPGECEGAISLWDFKHDADWYCFGPAQGWQFYVEPKVHVPQAGAGALHAVHIASVVMLHRYHVMGGR